MKQSAYSQYNPLGRNRAAVFFVRHGRSTRLDMGASLAPCKITSQLAYGNITIITCEIAHDLYLIAIPV